MPIAANQVSAVVLAGGHSRRFGHDKANALWRSRTLLEHVLAAVPSDRHESLLVLRQDQAEPTAPIDRIVTDDPDLGEGPLRGLLSGLAAIRTDWAWVVACDLPGIRNELLLALLNEGNPGSHATLPEWQGRLQPLAGLFSRSIVGPLREAADSGERSLIGALGSARLQILPEDWCRKFDPDGLSFANVNRPEDLARLDAQAYPGD